MCTNPSGGNRSRRAGATFLRNAFALFALLLAASNPAWAKTIFVDTGGNDAFNGESPSNQGGGVGPKATINGALAIAVAGDVISIEAGLYTETITIGINNLSFEARPDPASNFSVVRIAGNITNNASGTVFGATGAGTFAMEAPGNTLTLQSGSLTATPGKFTLPSGVTINRVNGSASGAFTFLGTVTVNYTGSASITSGAELPANVGSNATINVAMTGGTGTNPRTLTLAPGTVAFGNNGVLNVAANNVVTGSFSFAANAAVNIAGTVTGTITTGTGAGILIAAGGSVGNIDFTSGQIENNGTVAGSTTLNSTSVIFGTGNFGNLIVPAGGTADLNSSVTAVNVDINGGTLQMDGFTLTVRGNFNRTSGTISTIGDITFLGGAQNVTFAAGPNFVVNNLTIGGGTAATAKTVNFTQDVRVQGNFNLTANSVAQLNERTITFASAGTFTVNGTITSSSPNTGGVVFAVPGATLTGTGTVSNIDVVTGGGAITVASAADLTFTGTLSLTNGGIVIAAGGDLSAANPANNGGSFARVLINVADPNTTITGDPFNKDNQDYDLTYTNAIARGTVSGVANGTRVVGQEFDTADLRNLLVDIRGGTLNASGAAGGTIAGTVTVRTGDDPTLDGTGADVQTTTATVLFPNAPVIVLGAVTVEEDASLNTASTIELRAATNTVAGTLDGGGTILLANGVTVTGGATALVGGGGVNSTTRTQQATIGNVATVANATAVITNMRQIAGTVTTATGSSLTVSLVSDAASTGFAANNNAGNITGVVQANGANLTFASNVQLTAAGTAGTPTIDINAGVLTLNGNLVLSNAAAYMQVDNVASVNVTGTGTVIFQAGGTLDANGKTIPRLTIGGSVAVPTAVVVSTAYTQAVAGADLTGAGNVTLSGAATFAGGAALSGTGVNTLQALTAAINGNTTFSSARVNGDVTLTSSGTGSPFDLTITGLLTQDAGTLALGSVDLILTGAGLAYDFNAGSVTSAATSAGGAGSVRFMGGAAQTFDLASALTIPYLIVDNAAGVSAVAASGNFQSLTIGTRLELRNGVFDAEANSTATGAQNGDLVFANGVTIVRWSGSSIPSNDTPTFGTGLIYEYGDLGAMSGPLTTGRELFPATGTISTLRIFDNTTLLEDPNTGTLQRIITVSDTLRLAATLITTTEGTAASQADDDWIVLANNAFLVLQGNGSIATDNVAATREVVFTNYRLEYRDFAGAVSFGEFPSGGVVTDLVVTQRGTGGSPTVLTFPQVGTDSDPTTAGVQSFTRQVQNFTVRAGQVDLNGNRFSIRGNADFTGATQVATVTNPGAVVTTGPFAQAVINTFGQATLAFEGNNDATLTTGTNGGARGYAVPLNIDFRINKGNDSPQNDTTELVLQGGFLDFAAFSNPLAAGGDALLYLDRGILVAGTPEQRNTIYVELVHNSQNSQNVNAPDRGQGFVIASENPPGREAYVSGNVIKEFSNDPNNTAGTGFIAGRVVYPVGDRRGNYSPITLDFESNSQAAAQSFSTRRVTVNFVDQRPTGTLGFPIAGGVGTGQDVTNYANFYWFIASDPALGSGTTFNVEARAEGYRLEQGENITQLRLVRRETGDAAQNAFTLVGTAGAYQNFLIDPGTPASPADDIPVVLVRGASAFLSPQGSIFTFGNQRGSVIPPPPPPATNVAQVQIAHLAPNALASVDVYVNGTLVADNLNYLNATGYLTIQNVNGTANLSVAIAPNTSTSVNNAVRTVTVSVAQGQSYFVGIVDDGADATPGSAADVVVRQAGGTSSQSGRVEFFGLNAVAGAGPVDFRVTNGAQNLLTLFRNVAYGQTTGTEVADPNTYNFDVVRAGTTQRLVANQVNLTAAAGQRGVLAFVGNLTDSPLSQARNKQIVYISPSGQVITGRFTTGADDVALPTEFALKGAFPNPFASRAAIRFDLPQAGEVSLVVVDMMGREVMRVPATAVAAGAGQRLELDGQGLAAGMYLYRLTAVTAEGTKVATGQITLVK